MPPRRRSAAFALLLPRLTRAVARLAAITLAAIALAAITLAVIPPPAKAAVAPSPLFTQGVQAYQQHNYADALTAFTQVIQAAPPQSQLAAAYSDRCLVELELQAYEQAIADCSQGLQMGLQLGLTGTEPYLNRGLAYYRLGNYAAAVADYSHILAATPNDYRALYNRGLAQAALGQHGPALRDYRRSLQLSPQLPPERMARIHLDRGLSYLQLERYDDAVLDFSQAIAYNDTNIDAYFSRAYVAHRRGEDSAEFNDLNRVLAIDPTQAKTHFNLGVLHYQQGRIASAIASFEQAAHHFLLQNSLDDYRQVVDLLQQLQPPVVLA